MREIVLINITGEDRPGLTAAITGVLLQGGVSFGRTVSDNCFVVDSPQQKRPGFCRVELPWSTTAQLKLRPSLASCCRAV